MRRRSFLKSTACLVTTVPELTGLPETAYIKGIGSFRRPAVIIPVPIPAARFQKVEAGFPDTQMTREATGLLREFSTPLLFNHSEGVFFWANEMGRQTGKKVDDDLVFICAAFHDRYAWIAKKFIEASEGAWQGRLRNLRRRSRTAA